MSLKKVLLSMICVPILIVTRPVNELHQCSTDHLNSRLIIKANLRNKSMRGKKEPKTQSATNVLLLCDLSRNRI